MYQCMSDNEVLKRAAAALRNVQRYPVGSLQRAVQWGIYESCAAELDRRAIAHVRAAIRQRESGEAEA